MKESVVFKRVTVLFLILALLLSFCSCAQKTGDKDLSDSKETEDSVPSSEIEEPLPTGVETVTDENKTVFYPEALTVVEDTYPVIAWANGTACYTDYYYALLKSFAKSGYIVVADSDVNARSGESQIDSIDYIIEKNGDSSSVFYNKVKTSAIGVCGHSEGGLSCIVAAQADSRIGCVVTFAGLSSADDARGLKVPCLFLSGTNDYVVDPSKWCIPSYEAVEGRAVYALLKAGIHTTCMTNPQKVSGYSISWFDAYLKDDAEAKKVFEDGGKLSQDTAWQDFMNKN